jgi:predicted MFS family arabinose efflux permease
VDPLPDRTIATRARSPILAAIISLFPFTIYSTFVVPIAETVGEREAAVGALRGTGGVAAVVVGIALAPVLARIPGRCAAASGLLVLAVVCVIATAGTMPAMWVFCLGIGASTAVLMPALLATAAGSFGETADGARAATIVTAAQSLAAVMAGPVIGLMSTWRGWQGALWITALLAITVAALTIASPVAARPRSVGTRQPGYLEAFAVVTARPQLAGLIAVAGLRTASFMGYLAFLAVHFHRTFAMDARSFTLVWTLSGASFFLGNYLAGRWARRAVDDPGAARVLSLAGLLPALFAVTAVMGFGHAIIAALVTTLIAHRSGDRAATVFSLNGAAMSTGVFAGAALGGLGLQLGGTGGVGAALAAPTLIAIALVPLAIPRPGIEDPEGQTERNR